MLDKSGITISTLPEIKSRLENLMRGIYGQDINLEADTPDGQLIGVLAQELSNCYQLIYGIYRQLDPYSATGNWLTSVTKYAGIVRRDATYSTCDKVIFSGKTGLKIPAGTILKKESDKWVVLNDIVIGDSGSTIGKIRSQNLGLYELSKGDELDSEVLFIGLTSIVADKNSEDGREIESDGSLLVRFMRSHTINNSEDKSGIAAALLDLPFVKQAVVYENFTNEVDEKGLPPHSINAVVVGGNDADIAGVITRKKIGGCGLHGEIETRYSYMDVERVVFFDRAKEKKIKVKLVVSRKKNFVDIDIDKIKEDISAASFSIGEEVYSSSLYCKVSTDNFYIKSITVDGSDTVQVGYREYAIIDSEDVEVVIE